MNLDFYLYTYCFSSDLLSFPPQDTVVALQALAYYAAFSGANAIDLRLNISSPTSSFLFSINSTNYRTYQSQEVLTLSNLLRFYLCYHQYELSSNFIFSRLMWTKICA